MVSVIQAQGEYAVAQSSGNRHILIAASVQAVVIFWEKALVGGIYAYAEKLELPAVRVAAEREQGRAGAANVFFPVFRAMGKQNYGFMRKRKPLRFVCVIAPVVAYADYGQALAFACCSACLAVQKFYVVFRVQLFEFVVIGVYFLVVAAYRKT